jgi:putative ATP-dependent endonuclease of OLD family
MKITNIRTRNIRCLYDINIPFENLTALVGRNGTGKSSILKAIDIFFDVNYSGSIEDYCDKSTDNPIEITITFNDFTHQEAELFGRYINN